MLKRYIALLIMCAAAPPLSAQQAAFPDHYPALIDQRLYLYGRIDPDIVNYYAISRPLAYWRPRGTSAPSKHYLACVKVGGIGTRKSLTSKEKAAAYSHAVMYFANDGEDISHHQVFDPDSNRNSDHPHWSLCASAIYNHRDPAYLLRDWKVPPA